MKEKKWINLMKAILFCVIGIFLFIEVSYMIRGSLAHTKKNISGYYAEKKNSLDAVMIGTSGSFSAYAPMDAWNEYGFASYNFCINCLGVDVMKYCIDEVYKTQTPDVLIIDCYPFLTGELAKNCNSEGAEYILRYNIDGFRYSWNRCRIINEVVTENKISYYFDIIKYHTRRSLSWDYLFYKHHSDQKGYNFLEYGNDAEAVPSDRTKEIMALPAELDQVFLDLLKKCEEVDSNILIIYYPYGYQSEDALKQLNYIRQKTEEAGFDFLDCTEYYKEIGMDFEQDYWNQGHFNIYGAEKITKFVGQFLAEQYHLKDRRGDETYRQWQDDYIIWIDKVKEEKKKIDEAIAALEE